MKSIKTVAPTSNHNRWRDEVIYLELDNKPIKITALEWARTVQGLTYKEIRVLDRHESLYA